MRGGFPAAMLREPQAVAKFPGDRRILQFAQYKDVERIGAKPLPRSDVSRKQVRENASMDKAVSACYGIGSRTPHGVRGLKLSAAGRRNQNHKSHSSRSAWIETECVNALFEQAESRTPHGVRGLKLRPAPGAGGHAPSHFSRSAWIETLKTMSQPSPAKCRTPHGVRGLKQFRI
ncbi:Hypothetical protein PYTT_1517 [Akkermansia glycaniphila]|uniref:Uncharacterized protein n=1 Tax=Akkermansia glycaniphila TaxID=1679444 RepID=A0A1H6LLC1_9BACT|nr:Hypothetical protein PYTT_1517 [Akkermansia glycaniphila]